MKQLDIVLVLTRLVKERALYIKQRVALENSVYGLCASVLGFNPFAEDKEKLKKLKIEVTKLQKKILNKKTNPKDLSAELEQNIWLVAQPLLQCRKTLSEAISGKDKKIEDLAKKLPIAHMVETIKGFGYGSLGNIVGHASRPLFHYSRKGIFKRFGVGCIDGERQGKNVKGNTDKGLRHGFCPRRRSVLWIIGDSLLKKQAKSDAKYGKIYREVKEEELRKNSDVQPIVAHLRAKRKMEKTLLWDLCNAWQQGEQ